MTLAEIKAGWDQAARENAMGNILSQQPTWDEAEFFERGRTEIADVLVRLEGLGLRDGSRMGGRALDFGCGVGRLTQALADHYDQVEGVDVSAEMLKLARAYNHHGMRVRYSVNGKRLRFKDGSFDLVYSMIVLQHMPPAYAESYVGEFLRVVKKSGVAVFEAPSCSDMPNRWLSMYGNKPETVEGWVTGARGEVVDIERVNDGSFRYTAVRA